MFKPRFAICVDGGFIQKVLRARLERDPTAADILAECDRIAAHEAFTNCDLLRIYYYDAPPATGVMTNPLNGEQLDLQASDRFAQAVKLHGELLAAPNVALRMGDVMNTGWRVSERYVNNIAKESRPLSPTDLRPNLRQKGVDIRIGLDIARLSLKDTVRSLAVVTGDTDFVPAFKFARREGIRVYLDTLGRPARPELIEHSDLRLTPIPTAEERLQARKTKAREKQREKRRLARQAKAEQPPVNDDEAEPLAS